MGYSWATVAIVFRQGVAAPFLRGCCVQDAVVAHVQSARDEIVHKTAGVDHAYWTFA